jgi:hypothetical protein
MVRTKRRSHGEDAIYCDAAKNRYYGAVSLGHGAGGTRLRRKVSGKTKQDVRDKLKQLRGADPPAGRAGGQAVQGAQRGTGTGADRRLGPLPRLIPAPADR